MHNREITGLFHLLNAFTCSNLLCSHYLYLLLNRPNPPSALGDASCIIITTNSDVDLSSLVFTNSMGLKFPAVDFSINPNL